MTLTDCISIIRQYGVIQPNISTESFDDSKSRFVLKNQGKSIWLTESAFQIKVEVHLQTQGDLNSCLISKIDNSISNVSFSNNDFRVYKVISLEELIDSMDLNNLNIKTSVLIKISESFFHCLNNLIPENIVPGKYFFGNPYYFPHQTEKERREFDELTVNYRQCKYDWEISRLKFILKNKQEILRFLPPIEEIKNVGITSYHEIKEFLESSEEFKYYVNRLREEIKVRMLLKIENDQFSIQFIEI